MSRLGNAFKSLIGSGNLNRDFERNFLTILSNIGFGDSNLKQLMNDGYSANTYVYSIINRIAESAADVPVIIENKLSNGDVEIITEGDFYNFVHRPNKENNYKSLTYQSIVYQLATGNVFQYGIKGVGFQNFSERWNLAPQYIEPKVQNVITGPVATSYKYNYSGTDYKLDIEEVMHLSKFNPDPASANPTMGLSPLQAAFRTLVASNEIITADASLIKNKGAIGLLSSKGQRPLTPAEGNQLDKSLKQKIGGGSNYGSIKVTSGDVDFIKFAMSSQDLQILESGIMKLRDLCSVYGVSSRMFNDPNGTTFNNSKEDGKKFYLHGVIPPLENDLDHFNNFFVPGWNERDNANYRVKLDLSSIEPLQEDQAKEMVKARTRSTIITTILKGVGTDWSRESAILQLMDALSLSEDQAEALVGEKPEPTQQQDPLQND